jgi:hypothetical protein
LQLLATAGTALNRESRSARSHCARVLQEKQELHLAYAELLQRAFRHRSERYLHNPDQLRLDLGDSDAAADAAAGLAEAIEEARLRESGVS